MKIIRKSAYLFLFLCSLFIFSVPVYAQTADVYNFEDLYNAVRNSNVDIINIKGNISFTKDIKDVPNRNFTINGNADQGFVIQSNSWSIIGKNKISGNKNTFSIINANIKGRGTPTVDNYTDGKFFIGGIAGSCGYGWDVYAKDVKYTGARFVLISNGVLTFDGTNEIYTNLENAYVNHVIFKANSIYKSSNSYYNSFCGYSTFAFNSGTCVADGTATIESGAKTYFNVGVANQPVFGGNLYKITVNSNALFDVNCLGHAVKFNHGSSTYYKYGSPLFSVDSGATVNIKQTTASNILNANSKLYNNCPDLYVPVYVLESGKNDPIIDVKPNSKFFVSGKTNKNSNVGVMRLDEVTSFNLNKPADFDIRNNAINSVALSSDNSCDYFYLNLNTNIKGWLKTNVEGYYDNNNPHKSYNDIQGKVKIKGATSTSTTNNSDFNSNFKFATMGRIALTGGVPSQYTVTFNTNGSSTIITPVTVAAGGTVNKPTPDPVYTGNKFIGWFTDLTSNVPYDFSAPVNQDIILYAKWEKVTQKFKVSFNSQGGSPSFWEVMVDEGNKVNVPAEPTKYNYSFVGWFYDTNGINAYNFDTPVTANVTLYASWSIIEMPYIVTFDTQGGVPIPDVVEIMPPGGLVARPAVNPYLEGYTFAGWFKDQAGVLAWNFNVDKVVSDTTIYAKYTPIKFCVIYKTYGGTAVPTESVEYGNLATEPNDPTKDGYIFDGWYKDVNYTTKWVFDSDRILQTTELHAKWNLDNRKYTVTFESNGGSSVNQINDVPHNTLISRPADPSKVGFVFGGWYKDSGLTQIWNFNSDKVIGNTTLYAKWNTDNSKYKVTFKPGNGLGDIVNSNIPAGSLISKPSPDPQLNGYNFVGWYKDSSGINSWDFANDKIYGDTVIYGKWTLASRYTVTFMNGTEKFSEKTDIIDGSKITKPSPDPVKAGNIFLGWYKEAALTNEWDFNTDVVKSNITLYAKWTPKTGLTVTFNANGGTPVPAKITGITAGNTIAKPTDPALFGYILKGWYTDLNYTTLWDFNTSKVMDDMTLHAKWEVDNRIFDVVFNSNGGNPNPTSQRIPFGQTVQKPTAPTLIGFDLVGWYKDSGLTNEWDFATPVTSNLILYAKWTVHIPNKYRVDFNSDGGSSVRFQEVNENELATEPNPAPTKPGFIFGGWYKDSTYTNKWNFSVDRVTAPITLIAKWLPGTFIVTFQSNGGSIVPEKSVSAGTTCPEPNPPTKQDKTFAGWYKEASLTTLWNFTLDTVNDNITLYAKWNDIVKYTVTFDPQNGSSVTTLPNVLSGSKITKPTPDPVKTGFTFVGWFKEANGLNPWIFNTNVVESNITLYAKYTDPSGTYKVTFDSNGGSSVPPITGIVSGSVIGIPPGPPRKTGYCFGGWYTDYTFTTRWVFAEDKVFSDMTLVAKWYTPPTP